VALSYRVEDKMGWGRTRAAGRQQELTLAGIPAEAFEYRLATARRWSGDRSVSVYTDARSGITSDPNREDDPEYIVRLVGQWSG